MTMIDSGEFNVNDSIVECAVLLGYLVKNTDKIEPKIWSGYLISTVALIDFLDPEKAIGGTFNNMPRTRGSGSDEKTEKHRA